MTESKTFLLAMEALAELAPEIKAAKTRPTSGVPTLKDVLTDVPELPHEALFLGMADDGLPILLNLQDAVPGPLLLTADEGGGKTAFLRLVAQGIHELHPRTSVQFGVVTPNPEEWKDFQDTENCVGIFPVYHSNAKDYIFSLGEWAHSNRSSESQVLLIDDLHRVLEIDGDAKDTLRWLLLRGPARHTWPIVTLKSSMIHQAQAWMDYFRTRIFGKIKNREVADSIAGATSELLETLIPGYQYVMREGMDWLRFWTPRLDDEGRP